MIDIYEYVPNVCQVRESKLYLSTTMTHKSEKRSPAESYTLASCNTGCKIVQTNIILFSDSPFYFYSYLILDATH